MIRMKYKKVCTYANTNHIVRLVFKLLIMNETSRKLFFFVTFIRVFELISKVS